MTLLSKMSNTELLDLYGYEPYGDGQDGYSTVAGRWKSLTSPWSPASALELGHLRQVMLEIHLDLCPDDERWLD